jgi:hypothetical protein
VALAEAIPGAKLRVLEDAGHLVFIERAEEVNREIIFFLKPRRPRRRREPQRPPAKGKMEKLKEGLLHPSRSSGGSWARKLLGWLSR